MMVSSLPCYSDVILTSKNKIQTGLELSAAFVLDSQRENLKWLTVNYECKSPGLYMISARLQMIDFDERQRDITFFWQKQCSQSIYNRPLLYQLNCEKKSDALLFLLGDTIQSQRKQGWLARLTDLDPAKPIYDVLEHSEKQPGFKSSWSFLATSVVLMVCAAGAAVLITAVVMDALDGCFSSRRSSSTSDHEASQSPPSSDDEGEHGTEDEEKKLHKMPEAVPPPMPIFSTHLVQPDPTPTTLQLDKKL